MILISHCWPYGLGSINDEPLFQPRFHVNFFFEISYEDVEGFTLFGTPRQRVDVRPQRSIWYPATSHHRAPTSPCWSCCLLANLGPLQRAGSKGTKPFPDTSMALTGLRTGNPSADAYPVDRVWLAAFLLPRSLELLMGFEEDNGCWRQKSESVPLTSRRKWWRENFPSGRMQYSRFPIYCSGLSSSQSLGWLKKSGKRLRVCYLSWIPSMKWAVFAQVSVVRPMKMCPGTSNQVHSRGAY